MTPFYSQNGSKPPKRRPPPRQGRGIIAPLKALLTETTLRFSQTLSRIDGFGRQQITMRQTHQQLTPAMQRSTPDTTKLSQLQLRPTHTQNRSPNLPYRINAEKVFPRNQQNKPVETRRITYFQNQQTLIIRISHDSRPLSTPPILNEIVTKTSKRQYRLSYYPHSGIPTTTTEEQPNSPSHPQSNPLLKTIQKQDTQSRTP